MSNRARARQAARAAWERKVRQQRQQRRRRAAWISALAIAVLLLAGLAGAVVWQANRPGEVTAPTAAAAGEGLQVGSGPVTVDIYLDFLCPACAAFDAAARPTLDGYLADGTVTVVYHPISILDRKTTTEYSTRAAAAAGCAADAGQLDEFVAGTRLDTLSVVELVAAIDQATTG